MLEVCVADKIIEDVISNRERAEVSCRDTLNLKRLILACRPWLAMVDEENVFRERVEATEINQRGNLA